MVETMRLPSGRNMSEISTAALRSPPGSKRRSRMMPRAPEDLSCSSALRVFSEVFSLNCEIRM